MSNFLYKIIKKCYKKSKILKLKNNIKEKVKY